ncbi:unnamed protein product [Adineta steineri]|uniref:Uncharacterized protein n=1 Tax=Adineta steineri TaxID=433720 RepID=A0A819ZIE5_9BILA|nr:unnamed protein product [Adineta steineri]
MPRVPITTVNLLSGYEIPQNDKNSRQYICCICRYCVNRSRNKWIQHMYNIHSNELEPLAITTALNGRKLIENKDGFILMEENEDEDEVIEQQQDNINFGQQIKDALQEFKSGIMNEDERLNQFKILYEKKLTLNLIH